MSMCLAQPQPLLQIAPIQIAGLHEFVIDSCSEYYYLNSLPLPKTTPAKKIRTNGKRSEKSKSEASEGEGELRGDTY